MSVKYYHCELTKEQKDVAALRKMQENQWVSEIRIDKY